MALQTLLEPLEINHMTLKNRIMFPPMTTGYEARDGSITEQSINFYKRVAEGGASYIVLGDVTPCALSPPRPSSSTMIRSPRSRPWPTRCTNSIASSACRCSTRSTDTVAVAELFAKGDMAGARAKLHHDMQHYINEVTGERLQEILGPHHRTGPPRHASRRRRHRSARRPSGRLTVLAADQPAHRRIRRQLREPDPFRPRGRTRHPRGFAGHLHRLQAAIITENPQLGRGGLFIDEAVTLAPTTRGRRR